MPTPQAKSIKLLPRTYARLDRLRESIRRAYEDGRFELPDGQADHLSFDFTVNLLIDRVLRHRRRARQARSRQRQNDQS